MSWFLRSKKKKQARKAKPKTKAERGRFLVESGRVFAGLAVVALAVAGWCAAEPWLQKQVADAHPGVVTIELADGPAWLGETGIDLKLGSVIQQHLSHNPFDHAAVQAIAADLEASPWVKRLDRVQRRRDGRLSVWAEYRRPEAIVEHAGAYHLVDADGVRLPSGDSRAAWSLGRVLIRGVAAAPPPVGHAWQGDDTNAALRLARLVAHQPWGNQVRAIDAGNYNGRRHRAAAHLTMTTHRGGHVLWGRAPGEEGVFEPLTAVKLRHLAEVQKTFNGAIDAGGPGWRVAVYGDTVDFHRPDSQPTAYAQP